MAFAGGWLYDKLREIPTGADPAVLVEWSEIVEKKANARQSGSARPTVFEGRINQEGRFSLTVDVPDSDARVRLLRAIQDNLDLMPAMTKEVFTALMASLASEADP